MTPSESISVQKAQVSVGFKGINGKFDESILSADYSPLTYGFTFRGGVLRSDIGVRRARSNMLNLPDFYHDIPSLPSGYTLSRVFHYQIKNAQNQPCDRLVAVTTAGTVFYISLFNATDVWHELPNFTMDGDVTAVNYNYLGEDVLLMASSLSTTVMLNDTSVTVLTNAPRFTSLAVHYERIFATGAQDNAVWFSDDFNPTNWTVSGDAAGYINFDGSMGRANRVVSFADYVYVFCERGIYRLTAYAEQSDFSVAVVFNSGSFIYANTVTKLENRIYFLSDDGMKVFDGVSVASVFTGLKKLHRPSSALMSAKNNKLYLAVNYDFGSYAPIGNYVNNSIIEFDLSSGEFSLMKGIDVRWIITVNSVHLSKCYTATRLLNTATLTEIEPTGAYMDSATEKTYLTPKNTFGTPRRKVLRRFSVTTKSDLTVTIYHDADETQFTLSGDSVVQSVPLHLGGYTFGIKLCASETDCLVSGLLLDFDVLK